MNVLEKMVSEVQQSQSSLESSKHPTTDSPVPNRLTSLQLRPLENPSKVVRRLHGAIATSVANSCGDPATATSTCTTTTTITNTTNTATGSCMTSCEPWRQHGPLVFSHRIVSPITATPHRRPPGLRRKRTKVGLRQFPAPTCRWADDGDNTSDDASSDVFDLSDEETSSSLLPEHDSQISNDSSLASKDRPVAKVLPPASSTNEMLNRPRFTDTVQRSSSAHLSFSSKTFAERPWKLVFRLR
eukprot:NODE_3260_length_1013_cov_22.811203_g2998_i0.p1 GENE.NODE_3260_length_1013_cov_22.811203_g2998_i0~~NODE_3260_length_1013_cov_22.811203_g2998_i0.p1  ORF type:complete len:243 (+),score=16.11 NODE_3260_length_1013_cov_22.811203_g2998_i0:168-896(+)